MRTNAKDHNTSRPFELNYEVVVRMFPAGRDPVELVFNGGNSYALHPDHLRMFHTGFADIFDNTVRVQTLIALAGLLGQIAKKHEADAGRDSVKAQPGTGKGQGRSAEFGSLDLREEMILSVPAEFEMPEIATPQVQAA